MLVTAQAQFYFTDDYITSRPTRPGHQALLTLTAKMKTSFGSIWKSINTKKTNSF